MLLRRMFDPAAATVAVAVRFRLSLKIMEKFVEVRQAERQDCPEIRNLIQELANYEEMPDGPKISHKVLEKDGFDCENPLFNCYVAICDGKIVGYALYFYIFYTLDRKSVHLEDLYVSPEYRQKHIGSRLFDTLAKKTFRENCGFLDFSVLGWNPARDFYEARGAENLTETQGWRMYRLDQDSVKCLASTNAYGYCEVREARFNDFHAIKTLAEIQNRLLPVNIQSLLKKTPATVQRLKDESNSDDISILIEENSIDQYNPFYGYFVGLLNGKVVGYVLYCYAYSTWEGKSMYLQELCTLPGENEVAIKDDLIVALAKKAVDEKCSRIDFWLLDRENTKKVYVPRGAVDLTDNEDWNLYRLFELTKKPA